MATAVAGSVLIAWLIGAGVLVRLFHRRAWRIEIAQLSTAEQSYALQRLLAAGVAATSAYALLGLATFAATSVALDGRGESHWVALAVAVAGVPVCVAPTVAVVRGVRRSVAHVRNVAIRAHGRRSALVLAGATTALVVAAIVAAAALLPRAGAWHVAGLLLVYLVCLLAVQIVVAPLLVVSLRARPLPEQTRLRLRRLALRMGVQVRDIRAVPGRAHRVANAAQIGAIPGLRYVVVTDYLLDELPADQVDAVVAHELGHVRGHHLVLKLLAVFGVWSLLEAVVVGVSAFYGGPSAVLLLVPVLLAFPLGLLAVQLLVGVRLEQWADDAAARVVGSARVAAALESIARLNTLKPDTARLWDMVGQHPGFEERLRRLRRRMPATTSSRVRA